MLILQLAGLQIESLRQNSAGRSVEIVVVRFIDLMLFGRPFRYRIQVGEFLLQIVFVLALRSEQFGLALFLVEHFIETIEEENVLVSLKNFGIAVFC